MQIVKTPAIIPALFPSALWKMAGVEKCIYLTFDDGPEPSVTPEVLSILKRFHARATFFCLGKNIQCHAELFSEIVSEGHSVGNHTYSHFNGWKTGDSEYFADIEKCSELLDSALFRPPYGKMSLSQYREVKEKYKVVMWDVLSYDFSPEISNEKCFENVITQAGNGSIVIFHDSLKAKEKVLYALPRVLEHFSALGYSFKAIPQDFRQN